VFEMAALIQSPAKCKVHSDIRFLNAKGECPAEIHKHGSVMNWQNVTQSGAMNSPMEGQMFMTNKGAVGHL